MVVGVLSSMPLQLSLFNVYKSSYETVTEPSYIEMFAMVNSRYSGHNPVGRRGGKFTEKGGSVDGSKWSKIAQFNLVNLAEINRATTLVLLFI